MRGVVDTVRGDVRGGDDPSDVAVRAVRVINGYCAGMRATGASRRPSRSGSQGPVRRQPIRVSE